MNSKIRKTPLILGLLLTLVAVTLLLLGLFRNELFPEYSPANRGAQLAVRAGCMSCHGSGGPASVNPARSGPSDTVPPLFSERQSPDELRQWIRNGVPDDRAGSEVYLQARSRKILQMPGFGGRLNESEIEDLASYVALMQYGHEAQKSGSGSDGEKVARKFACFTCHGELGQGGVENLGSLKGYIPGFFGSDFRALTRNGSREDIREWILDGHSQFFWEQGFAGVNPGRYFTERQAVRMPAYRGAISEPELESLADLLIELMNLGPLGLEELFQFRPSGIQAGDAEESGSASPVLADSAPFEFSHVAAILEKNCLECHGPQKQKSGYRMDYRDAALKGGDICFFNKKAAVDPGHPSNSLLFEFVTAEKELPLEEIYPMPPDDRPRLSPSEIEVVSQWILNGAVWPEGLILGRPE
jgi:mono/diheme cytochrome c family protein